MTLQQLTNKLEEYYFMYQIAEDDRGWEVKIATNDGHDELWVPKALPIEHLSTLITNEFYFVPNGAEILEIRNAQG